MIKDELGKRMKKNYEEITKYRLTRRMPVIVRIDGKAFHTHLKGFKKPFDSLIMQTMQETMKYLCENIQGCVLGYTQSDEISLLLIDYENLHSDAYYDNEIQKICSVTASMATMQFNRTFTSLADKYLDSYYEAWNHTDEEEKYVNLIEKKINDSNAMFDSRCFNIPKEEVTNYFYWRQLDATRNSIASVGQAYFSHKELMNKSSNMIQDMLHEQKGINWNDYSVPEKRESCAIRPWLSEEHNIVKNKWIIDQNIPIFTNEGREYIEKLI